MDGNNTNCRNTRLGAKIPPKKPCYNSIVMKERFFAILLHGSKAQILRCAPADLPFVLRELNGHVIGEGATREEAKADAAWDSLAIW